jgi:hypothetical protein
MINNLSIYTNDKVVPACLVERGTKLEKNIFFSKTAGLGWTYLDLA